MKTTVSMFFAVAAITVTVQAQNYPKPGTPLGGAKAQVQARPPQLSTPTPTPGAEVVGAWTYETYDDPMGRGTSYLAKLTSTNMIVTRYGQSIPAFLTLRFKRGEDPDIYIDGLGTISTDVWVRFDNDKMQRFHGLNGEHSWDILFIMPVDFFIHQMKKAKRVRIEVNLYGSGREVLEFDVTGFDTSKLPPLPVLRRHSSW